MQRPMISVNDDLNLDNEAIANGIHSLGRYKPSYRIRVDNEFQDEFENLRDAIGAAKASKRDNPMCSIEVVDYTTGMLVIDVN